MAVLLSIPLSIHSPPMDRFASEMLTGLWASLHRPSLLLLRCQSRHTLSCPHYPLARQCGTALLLGLCSNAISLAMPFPGSGSLLCISEGKAHTSSESFLIAALETSNVSWSPCHLHNAELCTALWNECVEGRCDTQLPSARGYWSLFIMSCQSRDKMGYYIRPWSLLISVTENIPPNIFAVTCFRYF